MPEPAEILRDAERRGGSDEGALRARRRRRIEPDQRVDVSKLRVTRDGAPAKPAVQRREIERLPAVVTQNQLNDTIAQAA